MPLNQNPSVLLATTTSLNDNPKMSDPNPNILQSAKTLWTKLRPDSSSSTSSTPNTTATATPKPANQPQYASTTLKSPSAHIYLDYDPSLLPPKPSEEWTRFVCVSDTHTRAFAVPPGDVLLHSGDLTNHGSLSEFEQTVGWLCSVECRLKIIIAGNHDLTLHKDWFEQNRSMGSGKPFLGNQDYQSIIDLLKGPKATKYGLVYLEDEEYRFTTREGGREWSVYGSPWSPEFCNWAFGYERGQEAEDLVSKFPKTDILLTHGPPFNLLDATTRGPNAGCAALRARLPRLQPRLHVFGHIHEARGGWVHKWGEGNLKDVTMEGGEGELCEGGEMEVKVEGEVEKEEVKAEGEGGEEVVKEEEVEWDENIQWEDIERCPYHIDATPDSDTNHTAASLDDSEHAVGDDCDDASYTAFINAAAWPAGERMRLLRLRDGMGRAQFGGPGFQPIVVDLKE